MASKHRASPSKHPDSREKKPKGENEDDTWSSTLATLKAAPKEKHPIPIDGLCPLSTELDARVRAGRRYSRVGGVGGCGWERWRTPRAVPALLTQGQPQFSSHERPMCSHWDISAPSPSPNATRCQPRPCQSLQVYEDYGFTLNQTNISANNNKFYIIQLLEHGGTYSVWSRWGRVVSPPGHHSSPTPQLSPPCLWNPKN